MSTPTVGSSNTSRVTGLVSGLDTDALVKAMTSGTTGKIDDCNQEIELLKWKQEDYLAIIKKMRTFKDDYFSSSSGCLSSSFYNIKKSLYNGGDSSEFVSVNIGSDSSASAVDISNITTATAAVGKTAGTVCSQITLGFDSSAAPIDMTGKNLDITVGGVTKTITFEGSFNTAEEFASAIQSLSDDAFGTDRLDVSVSGNQVILNSDGSSASVSSSSTNDALGVSGITLINAQTARVDTTKKLSECSFATPLQGSSFDFEINGQNFSFTGDQSLAYVINTINSSSAGVRLSYSSITDKFTITSKNTGEVNGITISDTTGNFLTSILGTLGEGNYTKGTDASAYISGIKVTRPSNTFTVDGITYTLKKNTTMSVNVNTENNVDKVVENIKKFVSDYNDILNLVNTEINEKRYKTYEPLTDEQKKSMTDKEIEQWDEKAKSGMLKNDTTLSSVASSLRESMYSAIVNLNDNSTGIGITLADIGIETASYSSKGKLNINEEKLKEALNVNTESVVKLFTQKSDKIYLPTNTTEVKQERFNESGVMNRISDILEGAVGTLYTTGNLLTIAGYEGTSSEANNTISRSISSYNNKLTDLKKLLSSQETRYYKQFSAMETAISEMNQQISSLTSYLGN